MRDGEAQSVQQHPCPDRRAAAGTKPSGYTTEARSHNAVVAAVAQARADWGIAIAIAIAIATVARRAGLGFLPLREEHFDFVMPRSRAERPAVRAFSQLLREEACRAALRARGFTF